ncbi:hypothetical protein P9J64_16850 [Deltaproteobacteria bacterium IMCC39524]|nr:hypothetical protein [Deltaproteobacteria bacterium IMCC39524]
MKFCKMCFTAGLILFFLTISTLSYSGTQPGDALRMIPKPTDGPVEVRIGFHLIDITDINEPNEEIEFEGAIVLKWSDPRQAYDPFELALADINQAEILARIPLRVYQGDFAVKEIYQGWRPHIKISNGIGDRNTNHMAIGVYPDGTMVYAEYFQARAETPMDLRTFPFDNQRLEVYLHPYNYQNNEVVLVYEPEMTGTWVQDKGIAEWTKQGINIREKTAEYVRAGGSKQYYSELVVDINIGRRPGHIIFSIILPLLILVSLSWCVFWMDEESIASRVNISLVGILSVVAYYFVVLDNVPAIPYLTMMDAFMISTFLMLAATVVISFAVEKQNRSGRKGIGDQIDFVCRWAFPLGYTLITGLIVLVYMNVDRIQ